MCFKQALDECVSLRVDPRDHVRRALIVAGPGTHRPVERSSMTEDEASQLSQAVIWRVAGELDRFDDIEGRQLLPSQEQGIEELPPVREMPIKASFRDPQFAREGLHSNRFDALISEDP